MRFRRPRPLYITAHVPPRRCQRQPPRALPCHPPFLTSPALAPCCNPHATTPAAFYANLVVRAGWNDVTNTSYLTQNSPCATASRTFNPGELVSLTCNTGPNYVLSIEVGAGSSLPMDAKLC